VENYHRRWEAAGVPPNHQYHANVPPPKNDRRFWEAAHCLPDRHYDDNILPWKMTIAVEGPVVGLPHQRNHDNMPLSKIATAAPPAVSVHRRTTFSNHL
jgi:hypothetical protein